jgi:hypothetical protein
MVLTKRALCVLVLLPACTSSGVVPGTAFDQPVEIHGAVIGTLPDGARPVVSVIWSDPWQGRPDVAMPPRWTSSAVTPAANSGGQAAVLLQLFRPPPSAALARIEAPTGEVAEAAVGDLVIIDDGDGDGAFDIDARGNLQTPEAGGGDSYLAGTQAVLIYVARAFPQGVSATLPIGPLDKIGYQLRWINCDGRTPISHLVIEMAVFEVLTSGSLVERRTCLRTHSP